MKMYRMMNPALVAMCCVLAGCGGGDNSSDPIVLAPTSPTPMPAPTSGLLAAARNFAAMPKDLTALLALRGGGSATFASGLPLNDLEHTLYDTDYIDGETTGFDTIMPYYKLELEYLPEEPRIREAIEQLAGY